MMRAHTATKTALSAALGLAMTAQAAFAGTLIVDAFRSVQAPEVHGLALEYHLKPFHETASTKLSLAFRLKLDDGENAWAGVGLNAKHSFASGWFVEGAVMPGYYTSNLTRFDLGSPLEFYSFAAIGHEIGEHSSIALAAGHMSNADVADRNPGRNFLTLRYAYSF